VSGNTVFGSEGNGTIRFLGTYSSIWWKNPLPEYFYGFTVGVPEKPRTPSPNRERGDEQPGGLSAQDHNRVGVYGGLIHSRLRGPEASTHLWVEIASIRLYPGVRCLLGASAAVGVALGVGGTILCLRRGRLRPARDTGDVV
jgi:hypothetical protein